MTELLILKIILGFAFVIAPMMTNHFYLKHSQSYSDLHKISLALSLAALFLDWKLAAVVWPVFCAFGALLFFTSNFRDCLTLRGGACLIPFAFSLISATWFFSGTNDLHLLGYNQTWSYYAAIHGSVLGWLFIGCVAHLSRVKDSNRIYPLGSFTGFLLFLCVAFGIDGVPVIKRVGVIGFTLLVPTLIGAYFLSLTKTKKISRRFAFLSLATIAFTMGLAVLNEFSSTAPRVAFGVPVMVLFHGILNAFVTVPCFYFAIRCNKTDKENAGAHRQPVVFFDDFCVFCNSSFQLLIRMDRKRTLRYSSLQGQHAQVSLDKHWIEEPSSVVFLSNGVASTGADAALKILNEMGGVYKWVAFIARLFPLFALNLVYRFIAQNRYRIFGKRETCSIPTASEKDLFIP